MQHFHVKGKLAPRYIGPFKILSCRGEVSYPLELPTDLSQLHDVIHVSLPRKYLQVPDKNLPYKEVDAKTIDLNHDLTYRERPIRILDQQVRVTRKLKLKFFKVQWTNHSEEEAIWEQESYLRQEFPKLILPETLESRDDILLSGRGLSQLKIW